MALPNGDRDVGRRRLGVLFACLFVAMIGFGITLPVLPFYAERMALRAGASAADVAVQVGLLTAIYPLAQLVFAPLWGHWSDALGRRRLVLVGIGGAAVGQLAFAFAGTLGALYSARALGGFLSSAIFPAAAGYVADATDERERARGMAWLGTASSLGAVVGPALGATLARVRWETRYPALGSLITGFAVPFLAAAVLGGLAFLAAMAWLPESRTVKVAAADKANPFATLRQLAHGPLGALLGLVIAGQFGLALFEATFALYARRMWSFGPTEVGAAFMVCGLVMSVAQTGAVALVGRRVGQLTMIATGFTLVGGSLGVLPAASGIAAVLATIGALGLGIALITPSLTALIASHGGAQSGGALGIQSAATSLGQLGGTLLGGALLGWRMEAPYVVAAILLGAIGMGVTVRSRRTLAPAPAHN